MSFFDLIRGEWRLTRVLTDHRADITARFDGTLSLTKQEGGLLAEEQGAWSEAPWGALPGVRRDRWSMDGDQVVVRFDHGGEFHRYTPVARGEVQVHHPCGQDFYDGVYCFDLPDMWRLRWQVIGPKKDYHLESQLIRI